MYILALCDKRSYVETGRHFFIVCNTGKKLTSTFLLHLIFMTNEWFFHVKYSSLQDIKIPLQQIHQTTESYPRTKIRHLCDNLNDLSSTHANIHATAQGKPGRQSGCSVFRIQNDSTGACKVYLQPVCEFKGSVLIVRLIPE